MQYVSRAGEKLDYALTNFAVDVSGLICADFGSNTGGFVDCLLQKGAKKVYAIETGYGVLDWHLRNNQQVIVMERTNAMYVNLPGQVDFITIDTSWTRLYNIMPNALKNLKPGGHIVALIKPHYESAPGTVRGGKLPDELIPDILQKVKTELRATGVTIIAEAESPILGDKAKNKEFLVYMGAP